MEPIDASLLPPPPVLPSAVMVATSVEAVAAAVRIQAFMRRKLAWKRMAKYRQRVSVIRELALTENKYLVSLRISTSDYLHPLIGKCSTSEEVLPADKIRRIFGTIEMVEILSKKLLVEFTVRSARINYWTRVGEVFLNLEKSMMCYAEYVKGYDAARAALGEALDNPKCSLNAFDQAVQKKHGIKLGIRDFLIMPVQRVPRYILLLKDILKQTEPSHPDYEDVKLAMAKLQEFTVHMDAEAQRSEALRIIECKLAGEVKMLQAGPADRRFLHEGPLHDESKQRKVYVFLFSDLVVVAKEPESKGSTLTLRRGSNDGKMQVIETVPLSELSRCTNIKSFSGDATYQFKFDGTTYGCSSDEERQIWINHIQRLLRELRSRAQKRMAMQVSPRTLMASSPSLRAPSAASSSSFSTSSSSASSGSRKSRSSRWSGTHSATNAAPLADAESLVQSRPEVSPKPARTSVSGFSMSLSSRKQRTSTAVTTEDAVVRTANPLLAMQPRQRSHSNLVNASQEVTGALPLVEQVVVSVAQPLSPPSREAGLPQLVAIGSLPPPPVLPTALRSGGSDIRRADAAEVLYDFRASSAREVSVEAGQVVSLVRTLPSGWTVVLKEDGSQGAVPTSYLRNKE